MRLATTVDLQAGGPGSGRHKEYESTLQQHGWEKTRGNKAGSQWMHMNHPGMYIARDTGVWGYRNPGAQAQMGDSGRDNQSLVEHLKSVMKK